MEKTTSPFNTGFGEEPVLMIERDKEFSSIKSNLDSETPETRAMIITGPRGSGKTVLLSKIKKYYEAQKNWITVDINPYENMQEQLASRLYDIGKLKKLFLKTEFDFSFQGISFSISGANPITNVNSLLDIILKYLKKKGIKVLIITDDISSSDSVKSFAYSFQSFLREGYNTFWVMTGLYENISKLENTNNLTFLLRTAKIPLDNLSILAITKSYEDIFGISEDDALKISKATMGYAYGYQLLGSILYKNNSVSLSKKVLSEYDISLENNVYGKIFSFLTEKEKEILYAMTESSDVNAIMKKAHLTNSAIQVYKKRLSNQGLVNISGRGKITFVLPRFKEFIAFQKKLLEE